MNRKNLIIVISIALSIILGAILVWYLFFRIPTNSTLIPVPGGSPFGQGGADIPFGTISGEPAGTGLDENGRPKEKLFRLVDTPVAGSRAYIKNGSTIIRYVDRATGHIYDVNPITLERIKITNNTLPKIYEAYFKNNASGVIIRSLMDDGDTIETTSLTLTPPSASASSTDNLYSVSSSPIRGPIDELIVTSDNSLVYTTTDGSVLRSDFDGQKPVTLFNSAYSEWRILAPNNSNIFVYSKASAGVPGYAYKISGGNLSKILGPFDSLTANSNSNGKNIAFSYSLDGKSLFQTLNLETKSAYDISPVTLAEKCVWSTRSSNLIYCASPVGGVGVSEPDSWYQGSTHFSDRLWRFDTKIGLSDLLSDPKNDYDITLDAENLELSPDEDYLIFMNRNDLTLWALKLN